MLFVIQFTSSHLDFIVENTSKKNKEEEEKMELDEDE
jgi:hypothetical protein